MVAAVLMVGSRANQCRESEANVNGTVGGVEAWVESEHHELVRVRANCDFRLS